MIDTADHFHRLLRETELPGAQLTREIQLLVDGYARERGLPAPTFTFARELGRPSPEPHALSPRLLPPPLHQR